MARVLLHKYKIFLILLATAGPNTKRLAMAHTINCNRHKGEQLSRADTRQTTHHYSSTHERTFGKNRHTENQFMLDTLELEPTHSAKVCAATRQYIRPRHTSDRLARADTRKNKFTPQHTSERLTGADTRLDQFMLDTRANV